MADKFTYRGKTLEELKQLDTREFTKYLKAGQRRATLRHLVIVPQMVGHTIYVYNGKEYVQVRIISEMLGHRLGEFSVTRSKVQHGAPGIGATRSSAALSVK